MTTVPSATLAMFFSDVQNWHRVSRHPHLYCYRPHLRFLLLIVLLFIDSHDLTRASGFSVLSSSLRPSSTGTKEMRIRKANTRGVISYGCSSISRFMGVRMVLTSKPTLSSPRQRQRHQTPSLLVMRDRSSSYWFNVGDVVEVVADDVTKSGVGNLKGKVGTVIETWEKCDVDPTCCCAEQVDVNMAVRVEFVLGQGGDDHDEAVTLQSSVANPKFQHYFAESEIAKLQD